MITKLNITLSKVLNYEQFKYGIGTIIRLFRLLPLKQGRSPLERTSPFATYPRTNEGRAKGFKADYEGPRGVSHLSLSAGGGKFPYLPKVRVPQGPFGAPSNDSLGFLKWGQCPLRDFISQYREL